MAPQSVLIVDDLPDKLDFLTKVVRASLDPDAWEVVACSTEARALQEIEGRGRDFAIALIDAYLTEPKVEPPQGLGLARRLRAVNPNAYIILVSRHIEDRRLLNDTPINDFVQTTYSSSRSNPLADLMAALHRAEQPILQTR